MAARSSVRRAARQVADLVRTYALQKAWPEDEFSIYMRAMPGGILHLVLVAPESRLKGGGSTWMDYYDLLRSLERGLNDAELRKNLRLSVRSREQVNSGGIDAISPDYSEYLFDTSRQRYVFRRTS